MRADFPVVLDAFVLAEAAVSDLFLRLSEAPGLLLARKAQALEHPATGCLLANESGYSDLSCKW